MLSACHVAIRLPKEEDGFIVCSGKTCFKGQDSYRLATTELADCKKLCRQEGYGAFVLSGRRAPERLISVL